MAAPETDSWSGIAPTAEHLDNTTHGSGTTAERTAITSWPATRPFLDTDENAWYYNSHVSAPSSVTWSIIGIQESSEQTEDLTNAESSSKSGANIWKGQSFTLGVAGKLYKITDIEFKTSGTASGNAIVGLFDKTTLELLAYGPQFTLAGNTTYKQAIFTPMLRGNVEYFPCVNHDTSAQIRGLNDSGGEEISETYAENPTRLDNTRTLSTGTTVTYSLTIYYREYN
jgi:hypothetical protein